MPEPRHTFPRTHRLSGSKAFRAVFDFRVRKNIGPLSFCGRPNGLDHVRLGLSVPRRVGTAVKRNRIKRLLREAYRLQRQELASAAGGLDVIVVVRPHAALELGEYQRMLRQAVESLAKEVARRARRDAEPPAGP